MGRHWGRQIPVAMTESDEKRFLAFLRTKAEITIFVASAPKTEMLTVDRLPPRKSGKKQFFIWNSQFAWSPDIAVASNGSVFIRDIHRAPVIEYGRDSFRTIGDIGRVFWSKGITPGGPYAFKHPVYTYAYDAAKFDKWYTEAVRWIKAHSRPKKCRHRGIIYYLPSAWLWHGWYKPR